MSKKRKTSVASDDSKSEVVKTDAPKGEIAAVAETVVAAVAEPVVAEPVVASVAEPVETKASEATPATAATTSKGWFSFIFGRLGFST